jgi:hypothetical protein
MMQLEAIGVARGRVRKGWAGPALLAALLLSAPDRAGAAETAVPGTALVYRAFAETEGGYDSNPDSLVAKTGSPFEKIEGGINVTYTRPQEFYVLTLKAREVHFDDLDLENRWDFRAALDTTFDLSPSDTLKIGTSYLRDFFVLERADVYYSYLEYAHRADDYRLKLQARSNVEKNLNDEGRGTEDIDVFNISRSEAYDYSRTDGQVSLLTFTRSKIQPFVIYDFANLDYFSQVANPLVDRNAQEQFGIVGLRFDLDPSFRIDIGGRVNRRDFEDKIVTDHDSAWFDINMYWTPMDTVKVTAIAERLVKEPSTSFGLADDVRTVGGTLEWNVAEHWRLYTTGYYDRIEAIGDDFRENKFVATLSISYEPNDKVECFLSALGKWVNEEVTGDEYDRYKIGAGLRYKF